MPRPEAISRLDLGRALRGSKALAELHGLSADEKAKVVDVLDKAGHRKAAMALARLLGSLTALGLPSGGDS